MSQEKQIEEMAVENLVAFLWRNTAMYDEDLIFDVAEALYNAGYRKSSEGEWIKDNKNRFKDKYNCSLCDCFFLGTPIPYCPKCGAKMKEGKKYDKK